MRISDWSSDVCSSDLLDWPLGDTTLVAQVAATVNLLGPAHPIQLQRNVPAALEDPTVRIHLYRKDPRPGRVIGHVTCLDADHDSALAAPRRAAAKIGRANVWTPATNAPLVCRPQPEK